MAIVLEAVPFRPAGRQRQHGVEPIQSLNGCLFVYAEHRCMLWRMQVQSDDVRRLGFEIRIVAGPIPFQSMRFQLRLGQNPLHRGFAETLLVRQFSAGPVGAAVSRFLLQSPDHPRLHCGRGRTRLAALMTAF